MPYLARASSLRVKFSVRGCCGWVGNQFPVGLAVKPTWAAHAGEIYCHAVREKEDGARACTGRGGGERRRVARGPSGMRDAACDTGNSFTWRGSERAAQHPRASTWVGAPLHLASPRVPRAFTILTRDNETLAVSSLSPFHFSSRLFCGILQWAIRRSRSWPNSLDSICERERV